VIEDDEGSQARLAQTLSDAGYKVDTAATGAEALQRAVGVAYAGITLDLVLPDFKGLGLLASIRTEGSSRASPVVGMTMPVGTGRSAAFSITDVLSKPIRTDEVVAAMAAYTSPPRTAPARVMVIDDDPFALDLMRASLDSIGIDVLCFEDGRSALEELDTHRPDAIVLDLMMPEFDGFDVLDALRRRSTGFDTPVFIWTSMILTDAEYEHLARSARAIVGKGGGELQVMLDGLRRRRPTVLVPATGS
ncbi:MAG: response regulator, partial [Caldimonas sp.]